MAIKYTQGSDKSFLLKFTLKSTGLPYDFTDLKDAEVKFKKTDGSTLTLDLSTGVAIYGHAKLGVLQVTIGETDGASIKEGLSQNIESMTDVGPGSAGAAENFIDRQIYVGQLNVYKPAL